MTSQAFLQGFLASHSKQNERLRLLVCQDEPSGTHEALEAVLEAHLLHDSFADKQAALQLLEDGSLTGAELTELVQRHRGGDCLKLVPGLLLGTGDVQRAAKLAYGGSTLSSQATDFMLNLHEGDEVWAKRVVGWIDAVEYWKFPVMARWLSALREVRPEADLDKFVDYYKFEGSTLINEMEEAYSKRYASDGFGDQDFFDVMFGRPEWDLSRAGIQKEVLQASLLCAMAYDRAWQWTWLDAFAAVFSPSEMDSLADSPVHAPPGPALLLRRRRLWILLLNWCYQSVLVTCEPLAEIGADDDDEEEEVDLPFDGHWNAFKIPLILQVWQGKTLAAASLTGAHPTFLGLEMMDLAVFVGNIGAIKALQKTAGEEVVGPCPALLRLVARRVALRHAATLREHSRTFPEASHWHHAIVRALHMPWKRMSLLTSGASQPSSVLFMIKQHPEIVQLILEFIGEAGADDVSVWRQRVSAE